MSILFLLFPESCTGCLLTVTCAAALDIHMSCRTLIIGIINALCRLAIDADRASRLTGRVLKCVLSFPALHKAFAACLIAAACVFSAYQNLTLAAQPVLIVGTAIHNTL